MLIKSYENDERYSNWNSFGNMMSSWAQNEIIYSFSTIIVDVIFSLVLVIRFNSIEIESQVKQKQKKRGFIDKKIQMNPT